MHFCIVHLQAHHSRPDINDVDITDENRIVIFFGFHAFEDRLHEIFQKGVYRNFMSEYSHKDFFFNKKNKKFFKSKFRYAK